MFPALIAGLIGPVADLIKKFVSKDEDQKEALAKLQEVQGKIIDTVVKLDEQKYQLMQTEAKSSSWLASNWRPLATLGMVICAVLASYGIGHPDAKLYDILNVLVGIYASSRGVEKIASTITGAIKK
jgi:Holin of 3TMs, for gene-transfer release